MPDPIPVPFGRHSRRQVLWSIGLVGAAGAFGALGHIGATLAAARAEPSGAAAVPRGAATSAQRAISTPTTTPRPTVGAAAIESARATTPTATATEVPPTATSSPSPTATATPSPTATAVPFADVLGQAHTSYAGAVPARATNVELASRKIDGAVVAPGEVFSFLDRLGPQTLEAGFAVGYAVQVIGGEPRTVPSLGGGICDVSTILFQAAFRAGLQIVMRYNHSLWIEHYLNPPDGGIGLDATVDVQPTDFRFRNNTADPLKISCIYQDQQVYLKLLGTNPRWTVTIAPPVVSSYLKTDPTPIRQDDPNLPAGTQVQVESAQDGFDVTWKRTVLLGGKVIDEYQAASHYLPAHNVISVGTKGASPTATATSTASPTPNRPTVTPTPRPALATATPVAPTATATAEPLAAGQVRVPALVGLPVGQAQALIAQSGLATTYVNYQGPADVPAAVLKTFPVDAVLSQTPPPGAVVPKGTVVYLAARKK